MKAFFRKICAPVLNIFENQQGPYEYKASYRTILKVVGSLFLLLSMGSLAATLYLQQLMALLPVIIFLLVASVCMIVGFLGSDKAVAKMWNSR